MTLATIRDSAITLAGTWSRPPDAVAKIAAAVAIAFALLSLTRRGKSFLALAEESIPPRRFVALLALVASLLSVTYISVYLRGGPRIIDATSYFLQGRALAHGDLAWQPLDPSASFRGRFLLFHESVDGPALGGIFPPGFPLVLAFGFMLGAPLVAGPALAGAIVVATYRLARTLAEEVTPALAEPVARTAALLSVVCAALRYHTADTMSHAASGLGVTIALTAALEASRDAVRPIPADASPLAGGRGPALVCGLALGYVVATRPVSLLPVALVAAVVLLRTRAVGMRGSLVAWTAGGVLPGLFLLLLSAHDVTGRWTASAQRMYYAVSDGPPGCFRWGFGQGVGCLFEHGDFVHARLEHGYGLHEAAGTTLRRLHRHILDVANLEPLALLVLLPLAKARRSGAIRAASALVGLQILAYAPFYFDGDYPGGGARFFADVLPVEHALLMTGLALAFPASFGRAALGLLALACGGFSIHAVHEHLLLQGRDGGRPMFEPDAIVAANITHGLVFVDTDHGFGLGNDPAARAEKEIVVARLRSDDRDRMLYDRLEHPPSFLYKFDASAKDAKPSVVPWTPPDHGPTLRFEAEAEWPALAQEGGMAVPEWAGGCASGGRVLVLTPTAADGRARASITLPVVTAGRFFVDVHVVNGASVKYAPPARGDVQGALVIGSERWTWKPGASCVSLPPRELALSPPYVVITLEAENGPIAVDYIALRKP